MAKSRPDLRTGSQNLILTSSTQDWWGESGGWRLAMEMRRKSMGRVSVGWAKWLGVLLWWRRSSERTGAWKSEHAMMLGPEKEPQDQNLREVAIWVWGSLMWLRELWLECEVQWYLLRIPIQLVALFFWLPEMNLKEYLLEYQRLYYTFLILEGSCVSCQLILQLLLTLGALT